MVFDQGFNICLLSPAASWEKYIANPPHLVGDRSPKKKAATRIGADSIDSSVLQVVLFSIFFLLVLVKNVKIEGFFARFGADFGGFSRVGRLEWRRIWDEIEEIMVGIRGRFRDCMGEECQSCGAGRVEEAVLHRRPRR